MKKLNCIVIGFEVLDDGPIFFGIAHCQERCSFVCKNRQTKEAKTKVYILFYKIFISSNGINTGMGFHALAKWTHHKVKLLQKSIISVLIILPSDIVATSQTRLVLTPRAILPSKDSKNSCYYIITKRTCSWRKHCWITCKEKLQK